jgi:transcriptional regulator with XRE-family HTH domain
MDINICENLKNLRKSKGNTQEELAGFLGISIQAVSKWERSEGYPDITLLPKIASYYNISVDDLLGVSEIKKQERINQIFKQRKENSEFGNTEANVKLMREAIKEFPNNYQIISGLMSSLFSCDKPEYLDEIIELGEKILSECTEDEIRYKALQLLCFTYPRVGNYDKAKEYAHKLPGLVITSNVVLNSILKGEELLAHTQKNLIGLVDNISSNVTWMLRAKEHSDEFKIYAYQIVIKFYELLFEDGDFGFYHSRLAYIYRDIARIYAKANEIERVIENLTLSAKHAIAFDTMENHKLTAPLVNTIEYRKSDIWKNWQGTETKLVLDFLSGKHFDFCRQNKRFKELVMNLSKYL